MTKPWWTRVPPRWRWTLTVGAMILLVIVACMIAAVMGLAIKYVPAWVWPILCGLGVMTYIGWDLHKTLPWGEPPPNDVTKDSPTARS